MNLVPVDFDPFAQAAPAQGGPQLVPVDHDPFAPQAGDESAAIGRGIINGIPIVGPSILGGVNRGAATVRSWQSGRPYEEELRNVQGFSDATATANPKSTIAGELGGAVVGTAPLVAAAPAAFGASAAPLLVRSTASALTGSAIGGADAAVRSGGDATSAQWGAGLGFVGGAAAPPIAAGAGRVAAALMNKVRPPEAVPTTPELFAKAGDLYQEAKDAGVQIAQPAVKSAVDDIAAALTERGLDPVLHPRVTRALTRLEEVATKNPTVQDMELARRVAREASSLDEGRLSKEAVKRIDSFMGRLGPDDVIAGDPERVAANLVEARTLFSRAKRAQTIEEATVKAERRAARTGSGGNGDNTIRQNLDAILSNPKKVAGFSEAEREAMDLVIRGSGTQDALRRVGKLSPFGNGLMTALGIGGAAASPMLAAVPAVGAVAKALADRSTRKGAESLVKLIQSGGEIPVSAASEKGRVAAERIAAALLAATPPGANQRLFQR